MRYLFLFLAMGWMLAFSGVTVRADQNDPKLDSLFERLLDVESLETAADIESQIWTIWLHRGESRVDSHMSMGIRAMNSGALKRSLQEFTKVIVLDPDFAEGWNKRATVHYMMGNLQHSVSDIQRTLALEPRHYGAISGMGLIFDATDNQPGALKAWQRVLKITPYNLAVKERVLELKALVDGKPI